VHLGSLKNKPTDSVERARDRLTQAAPAAVDTLEDLMLSAESEPVKLKAAAEILDRAGVRAGIDINSEVTVDVRPAAALIAERLQKLAPTATIYAESEQVEDGTFVVTSLPPAEDPEDAAADPEQTNNEEVDNV
jgi:hypothetical protein